MGCLYIFLGLMGLAFIGSLLPASKEKVASDADRKQKGFHCLSGWDGSHSDFIRKVKDRLREPASFEHMETKVTPLSAAGTHTISMKYRAKNGFGGMNVETAYGNYVHQGCQSTVLLVQ
jgi:hypothetical protein